MRLKLTQKISQYLSWIKKVLYQKLLLYWQKFYWWEILSSFLFFLNFNLSIFSSRQFDPYLTKRPSPARNDFVELLSKSSILEKKSTSLPQIISRLKCDTRMQVIFSQCERIHHAVYKYAWYAIEPKAARDLTLIMLRASKPVYITAGKTFPMTMATLCSVSYSIFIHSHLFSILLGIAENSNPRPFCYVLSFRAELYAIHYSRRAICDSFLGSKNTSLLLKMHSKICCLNGRRN